MVLGAALLNIQYYKVQIKGKVEQSRERSSALPYTCAVDIEKGAFRSPLNKVVNCTFYFILDSLCTFQMTLIQYWTKKKKKKKEKKICGDNKKVVSFCSIIFFLSTTID